MILSAQHPSAAFYIILAKKRVGVKQNPLVMRVFDMVVGLVGFEPMTSTMST